MSIGEYAYDRGRGFVTKDVEPYALMVGVPAKKVGAVSKDGDILRRGENEL